MVRLDNANASSVYGVSVDSRSRPLSQPDNKYEIELGRTLDRVKSLQLGSIQIPDCRYAFDSKSVLQYSEPITLLPNTHLFIHEEVRTLNTVDNTCVVENRVIQLLIPPTLNKIIDYTPGGGVDDGVVSAEFDTGLQFALTYYPLIGLTPSIVGAHFPQSLMNLPMPAPFPPLAGPVLTSATVATNNGGYYQPNGYDALDTGFQYTTGYLDALTTTAGNYGARHVLFDGEELCAWSYISCPKPTLTELFTMLNAALAAKRTAQDLAGSVTQVSSNGGSLEFTTAVAHGLHAGDQVVVSGTSVPAANNTFFVTTVPSSTTFVVNAVYAGPLVVTAGTWTSAQRLSTNIQFGFDDLNSLVIATGPSVKQSTSTGYVERVYSLTTGPAPFLSLAAYLGFGNQSLAVRAIAQVPAYILRTVQLRQGNYTAEELTSITTVRMNPLLFHQESVSKRTLNYKLPTGTPASLIIPCGRYTAQQLVDFLNSALFAAPANIEVSVNELTGKFTFTQQYGLPFMLLFEGDDNLFTAYNLGFEPVNYSGSSTYTSVNNALQGVAASDGGYAVNRYPSNSYWLSADPTQSHFTFDTGCPDNPQLVVNSGTHDTTLCPYTAAWNPVYDCAALSDGWCASWFPGDVLYAQAPYNFGLIQTYAGCVILSTEPHNLIDGQSVTISCSCLAGTYTVTVLSNTEFLLAPCCYPTSCTGSGGYFASNSTPISSYYTDYGIVSVTVAAAAPVYTATFTMVTTPPPGLEAGRFFKVFSVPDSNVEGVWEVTAVVGAVVTAVRTSATALTAGAGATSGYYLPFNGLAVGTITTVTSDGGTNLVTTVTPHGLQSGNYVKVTGSTAASANGLWEVEVTGSSTFKLLTSAWVADGVGGTFAQVSGLVTDASNATPVTVTSAGAVSGVVNCEAVSVLDVGGNVGANGTYMAVTTSLNTFELAGSGGTGAYTSGGFYLLNSAIGLFQMVATNTYTVVVKEAVSMLYGIPPRLALEPTVSLFSTLDQGSVNEALGEPSETRRIYVQAALRDVFQLFFSHPDAKAGNFGFPPVSWPPSTKTLQQFYAPAFPTYSAACQCVPVANTYQSPYCWNLLAPDYILMLLSQPCGSKDVHTHTWKKDTRPILAKLYITSPYLNISEQMLFSTFAGFQRVNKVAVEFQNPDGSLVEFNGRPHSYELLFTLYEDAADATCF